MAEAVIEIVLENLSSLIQKELGLFLGFNRDLKSLASLLTTIKATLEDAEERQFTDRAIKDWLQKLKDAAHVLDDILDKCAIEAMELEYRGFQCGPSHKVQSSFLSSFHPKHLAFRYKIAKKMKSIRERLDEIAEEKSKFHLIETVRERGIGVLDWRQTTSIITQPQVYGRDEDKNKIVDFLVGHVADYTDLLVYPIVGLGGLGKTTLAQLIYNHKKVVNHFELRIWVCVSEDFSLKRMTKAIIESATGHACADLDLDPLQRKLLDLLQGKRYLLVLDDVWDDEQENWQRLKSVLACGGKGTSVVVTTRLLKVASIMGTMPPHDLSILSDDDCWELFKQRAFRPNEVEQDELVVIGKEIVKKCGGVPLAALALGSLLHFKREKMEWLYIKESKLWCLQGENSIMPALRLSYLNLPVKLRQCFAFCALFPKDERISKQFVVELWTANGFISSNEMLDAEDIGNQAWNELYRRSFFQDIETDILGKISFKMHDLIHDLAQSIAEEVCCITNDNGIPSVPERTHHLSIYRTIGKVNSIQLHDIKSLKTCIQMKNGYDTVDQLPPHVLKGHSLRVLHFGRIKKLSSSIGHLKHLRYLNLSSSEFKTLPESLCELWNLQILKLDDCYYLQKLPDSLIHLKALHYLSLMHCYSLSSLAPNIRKLTSLRTLSLYIVGKIRGLLLAELGQLNLKGEIHIKNLERVVSVTDAKEANMSSKHLNRLLLSWERNEESQSQENVEQILEELQPHNQQLQSLEVEGYTGAYFPQWMSSPSLKYLTSLELTDCKSCLQFPQLRKLPSLKKLSISNMSNVIYIDGEPYEDGVVGGFLALECLTLETLPNLTRLSMEDRENMFPCLSILEITGCPNLLGLPCLPSIKVLLIREKCNQDLLISIYKLHSLEYLQIRDIDRLSMLEALPSESINLNAIQLTVEVLQQGLRSLRTLHIIRCQKFNVLASFPYLTCLERLEIQDCSEIEGFHVALQHMTALRSLALYKLPNLASLPDCFGNLGLLQKLTISECPNLTCLPTSIQCLASLKSLKIDRCKELGKRCQKETGEDWPKIAHVEQIEIKESATMYFEGISYSRQSFSMPHKYLGFVKGSSVCQR